MKASTAVLVFGAVAFTAAGGLGTAAVLGATNQTPTKTVTINVATGPTGPQGPKGDTGERGPIGPEGPEGPAGPAGTAKCPNGYSEGLLVINHPGGQTTIFTCIKD